MTQRRIGSFFLEGPAGRLEALVEEPEAVAPRAAALICHPHPQHGGTMHNKVVYRLARGLRRCGFITLRFNYRGVNLSDGHYDHGIGEVGDARTALDWLRESYPTLPFRIAGFSFGARVALRLGAIAAETDEVLAVGFPTRARDLPQFLDHPAPRVFVQSTHDEYGPRAELQAFFQSLRGPKELVWVPARDHFFAGALDDFEQAIIQIGLARPPVPK